MDRGAGSKFKRRQSVKDLAGFFEGIAKVTSEIRPPGNEGVKRRSFDRRLSERTMPSESILNASSKRAASTSETNEIHGTSRDSINTSTFDSFKLPRFLSDRKKDIPLVERKGELHGRRFLKHFCSVDSGLGEISNLAQQLKSDTYYNPPPLSTPCDRVQMESKLGQLVEDDTIKNVRAAVVIMEKGIDPRSDARKNNVRVHPGQSRVSDLVKSFNEISKQSRPWAHTRKSIIRRGSVDSLASLEIALPVKNSSFYTYERNPSPSPSPPPQPVKLKEVNSQKHDSKNRSSDDILSHSRRSRYDHNTETVRLSVKDRITLFSNLGSGMDSKGQLKTETARNTRQSTPGPNFESPQTVAIKDEARRRAKSEGRGQPKKKQEIRFSGAMKKSHTLCSITDPMCSLMSDSDDSSDSDEVEVLKDIAKSPDLTQPSDPRDSGFPNEEGEFGEDAATLKKERSRLSSTEHPSSPTVVLTKEDGEVLQNEADDNRYSKISTSSGCSSVADVAVNAEEEELSSSPPRYPRKKASTLGPTTIMSPQAALKLGALADNRANKRASLVETDLLYADALWDHNPRDSQELSFRANEIIEVLDMSNDDWWFGCIGAKSGWFPTSFVRLRVGTVDDEESSLKEKEEIFEPEQLPSPLQPIKTIELDTHLCLQPPEDKVYGSTKRRKTTIRRNQQESSSKKLTPKQVRSKVVEEILNTEREYIKSLQDIQEGYLVRCKQHKTLFAEDQVDTLFGNVGDLLEFETEFLAEMESQVDKETTWKSGIGKCFVKFKEDFPRCYSEYCNNHPFASSELADLNEDPQYSFFFESCRLLRNMPDLPLDSFLLKPVQKICKYPLQLAELLKYTDKEHSDYPSVLEAMDIMKKVAQTVNERKRRVENIYFIGKWKRSVDNWEGDDILDSSSELIHSGELIKISKGHAQERHFFLFDHQMVYCKKDAIGSRYSYKGRILTDKCRIVDIADGEVVHNGHEIRNAWKVDNVVKNKWYILYAKSPEVKQEWVAAFERERRRVKEDQDCGYEIPLRLKKAAFEGALGMTKKKRVNKGFTESDSSIKTLKGKAALSPALSTKNAKVAKRKSFTATRTRQIDTKIK